MRFDQIAMARALHAHGPDDFDGLVVAIEGVDMDPCLRRDLQSACEGATDGINERFFALGEGPFVWLSPADMPDGSRHLVWLMGEIDPLESVVRGLFATH
jgi:hypothetical protein